MTTATLPIDAHVIALDETDRYAILNKDRPYIEKIRGVYLFDANQRTYCCELTPSYYLIHLYDEVILTEEGWEAGDLIADEIYDRYEQGGGDDIYVHCYSIDALIEQSERGSHYHYGNTEVSYDDSDYDEQMEGLREHFCCNHAF